MEARDTVDREGTLDWHCSLLWVMKAGRELNCFLHFPHRKTSSSSVGGKRRVNTHLTRDWMTMGDIAVSSGTKRRLISSYHRR